MLFGVISPRTILACSSQKSPLSFSLAKQRMCMQGRIQDCCNIQDGAKLLAIITKGSILNVEAVQIRLWYGHLLEKIFLVCFSPLSPQAEQKEDDEHFVNHLHMYVSKNFTKAKKSAICSEYTMSSKFHLSKWKTYFSKFIDKYLTIEEVEYLIHYVKFKM